MRHATIEYERGRGVVPMRPREHLHCLTKTCLKEILYRQPPGLSPSLILYSGQLQLHPPVTPLNSFHFLGPFSFFRLFGGGRSGTISDLHNGIKNTASVYPSPNFRNFTLQIQLKPGTYLCPPERYAHVQVPGTCECDLIWK